MNMYIQPDYEVVRSEKNVLFAVFASGSAPTWCTLSMRGQEKCSRTIPNA